LLVIVLVPASALLLAASCGNKEPASDCVDDCRPRHTPYAPTAMDVPLPADFTRAAEKRVGADNYRRELSRIERELSELEPDREPVESERDVSAPRGASAAHR
jgi:hypothetical protein